MVRIIVNNNKSKLDCRLKDLLAIKKKIAIRAKNYFFSPAYRTGKWDGYVNYISDRTGDFDTGLLQVICNELRNRELKFEIIDRREKFKDLHIVDSLGDDNLREDQMGALKALLNNKLEGIRFVRGIMAEATNYGKSFLAAGVFASFSKKRTGFVLINAKTLFEQTLEDLKKLLPMEEVGWIKSGTMKLARVNVCMVQTLGNKLQGDFKVRNELAKADIIIMDEYDEIINRKDCQLVLKYAFNAPIRIGFTGTELMSKDKNKNMSQIKYCGPVIHKKTNKELVDMGISSLPNITFHLGNTRSNINEFQEEYDRRIVRNRDRHRKIWEITESKIEMGPVLILFKFHKHGKNLYNICPQNLLNNYKVNILNHKSKDRVSTIEKFREGNIDILICSMIIKRGLNIPYTRTLINAAGGDSQAVILQIFGRGLRKSKDGVKTEIDIEEFFDKGKYIQRHSKHRISYYKKQGFKVVELYK